MRLFSEECKPIQLLPETEGLQGALAFLYNGTPNEIDQSSKIVEELYNSDSVKTDISLTKHGANSCT